MGGGQPAAAGSDAADGQRASPGLAPGRASESVAAAGRRPAPEAVRQEALPPPPRPPALRCAVLRCAVQGDYASVGEPVAPTRFVPMKTPMSREIISNWTLGDGPKHSLTVPELLAGQAAKGRAIGMIIDLVRGGREGACGCVGGCLGICGEAHERCVSLCEGGDGCDAGGDAGGVVTVGAGVLS